MVRAHESSPSGELLVPLLVSIFTHKCSREGNINKGKRVREKVKFACISWKIRTIRLAFWKGGSSSISSGLYKEILGKKSTTTVFGWCNAWCLFFIYLFLRGLVVNNHTGTGVYLTRLGNVPDSEDWTSFLCTSVFEVLNSIKLVALPTPWHGLATKFLWGFRTNVRFSIVYIPFETWEFSMLDGIKLFIDSNGHLLTFFSEPTKREISSTWGKLARPHLESFLKL